jgi:hypothetical protein
LQTKAQVRELRAKAAELRKVGEDAEAQMLVG